MLVKSIAALSLAWATGDAHWDGYGSIVIGFLLTLVSWFLAREVKSLLEGERAHVSVEKGFREEAATDPKLGKVIRVLTLQQGPSQVMVAAKIAPPNDIPSQDLIAAINELELRVRKRFPEVTWQFIEPDVED